MRICAYMSICVNSYRYVVIQICRSIGTCIDIHTGMERV